MKRIICSLLTVMAMLAAPMTRAENITVEQAKDAAAHYLQHRSKLTRVTADQLTLAYQWNNPALGVPSMYLFSTPFEGWIIMAATTAMDPVVAYSDEEGYAGHLVPPQEMWLDDYNGFVCAVQNADAEKALGDSHEWLELSTHGLKDADSDIVLLTTRWNQGTNLGDDYNIFSPVINDSVAPTGCVATALAQICYYYSFPKQPKGSVSYRNSRDNNRKMAINFDTVPPLDYSIMPLAIRMSTSRERREEVSRLAYYLGLCAKMQFGADLSGTSSENAVSGMRLNMKYSRGTILYRNGTDLNYIRSLRNELVHDRPVYMAGASGGSGAHAGGHAWVCDGYKKIDTTKYHMNWGWGGTGNAFYNLQANNLQITGQPYNFKYSQEMIINMIPPADSTDRNVGIVEVNDYTELGAPYPNPASYSVNIPYSTREAATLQVFSINGTLVSSQHVQAGEGQVTLRVDALPAGIYVYRMGSAYGKLVVNK